MIEINGMAHVVLTVSRFDDARAFYCELLPFLGMHKVFDGNNFVYHVGGRTALGIQRAAPAYEGERFVQSRVGLHHLCLRARSREDVDKAAAKLREMGAKIDRGPMEREWAPGYYFLVFEDPDGIRLEINHIPGKGLLAGETPAARATTRTGVRTPDLDRTTGESRILTDEMQTLIRRFSAGAVATVNADGTPSVSPKATFVILDNRTLAFGHIRSPGTVANLRRNPAIEVCFTDIVTRRAVRVTGMATIVRQGDADAALHDAFDAAWGPYRPRMSAYVRIAVTAAEMILSPAYDLGLTEDELRKTNLEKLNTY